MGIFDKIKEAIFGGPAQAAPAPTAPTPPPTGSTPVPPTTPIPEPAATPAGAVDVAAVLDAAVGKRKLKWRTSIVDLMKALGLDSSLANRKALAAELGYTGDTSKSAAMNTWLHKQVIAKLKANGGKVPADLL